jgi:hypothetical protein
MARKRTPLDALDRLEMRVSWQDVERRSEDVPTLEAFRPPPRRTRLVAAATAFAVFVPMAIFAWVALRSSDEPVIGTPPPTSEVFFPTWQMDARPEALVDGTLVEHDGCLFSSWGEGESLILWERGLSYDGRAVLDAGGSVVARVGEPFRGAGGYYAASDRAFVEDLIGEPIPERCMPALDADGIVLVYDVAPAGGPDEPTGSSAAIVVTSPQPGDVVSTPVTIEGTANVFEGTVRIRIYDAITNQIVDTFTTATCGSGCEGTFSIPVGFSVAEEQQGEIVVFEESAETGKPMNQVRIPVTLLPGPTVEEASAFVGQWTDASGQAVGEEVVSSMLGPEHCSWGDIVFLRYASEPGGETTTFLRDTSGELASYTSGRWEVVGEPDGGLVDTGYRVNGRELWVDPSDPTFAILWDPANGVTERWPAFEQEVACA